MSVSDNSRATDERENLKKKNVFFFRENRLYYFDKIHLKRTEISTHLFTVFPKSVWSACYWQRTEKSAMDLL